MTLKDITLVMTADVRIVIKYQDEVIFTGTVDALYNEYIRYQGQDIDSTVFLEKVVCDVYYSLRYDAIMIGIE